MDPSRFQTVASPDLASERPFQLAVLPFVDKATGGRFLLDGLPTVPRSQIERQEWRWTTANRLRRGMATYLAQRDFYVQSPGLTDTILQQMGWRTAADMFREKAERVADWLGVDALVYGEVQDSMAIYAFLLLRLAGRAAPEDHIRQDRTLPHRGEGKPAGLDASSRNLLRRYRDRIAYGCRVPPRYYS